MGALSDKFVTHFRKEFLADKIGPTYRDEFQLINQFFAKEVTAQELAFNAGFNRCKKFLDEIIDAYDSGDFKEIDRVIDALQAIDSFAKENY